ncbi:putative Ig domain-containing protein [Bryobacter aggregatus]|uniref:putative Ig domain-containing protein n=1 Tax=Bryobacter aggregatus TaxID=360054 RepID=UPI000A40FAAD|nr:putative Ig domain-containing protein [Bryobacter aggregatus]
MVSVSGPAPAYAGWLLVSLSSGRTPQTLSVQVNPTGLGAGSYSGTILLTGTSGSPAPTASVSVTLTVGTPPPTITVSPSALSFAYTTSQIVAGNPALRSAFLLSNTGAATAATVSVQSAPWLKVTPTGNITLAGLFNSIQVSVDPSGLAPKVYTANITIKAAAAANPSLTIPVTLTVVAAPPTILSTWPSGLIQQSPQSVVTVNGLNYFANSTIAVSGFTTEATITVSDGTNTATESFFIPVYPGSSSALRIDMGSPLPGAIVGSGYANLALRAAGGSAPYFWAVSSGVLPPGLSISSGSILGTPSAAGTYYFTLQVFDSGTPIASSAYLPVKMIVLPSAPPTVPRITGGMGAIPTGILNTAYANGVSAAAYGGVGSYSWSATNLPAGLVIDATTGAITGTPVSVGTTGNLTGKVVGENAMLVTLPSSYLTSPGILRLAITTPSPGGGISNDAQFQIFGPQPQINAVVDSASFLQGSVSPGQIVTIFGLGLGPSALTLFNPTVPAPQIPTALPASSPSTRVLVNGTPAPILYTSTNQVSAIIPYSVSGSTVDVAVSNNTLVSQPVTLALAATAPGVYTTDASGRGQGAILNYNTATGDYSLNGTAAPALKGQTIVLYASGMGTTNLPVADTLVNASPAVIPNAPVSVTIGGQAAVVMAAQSPVGSVPGLLQLNVTVPATVSSGAAVPVVVNIGGVDSQAGVTMAIK